MKNMLRMLLAVALICAVLLPASSSYAQTYEGEQTSELIEQQVVNDAQDDAQFLRIEVTRKEDGTLVKAEDTSTAKDGTTTVVQGYVNVAMAEYNATDLSGYTTEELVVFILNNHRSMATMIYDHVLDPYTSAKRYYHGLEELEKHEDALEVLKRALNALETAEPATDTERIIYDMRTEFLRMVLNSEFYQEKMTAKKGLLDAAESVQNNNGSRTLVGYYGFLYDYAGTVYSKGKEIVSVYSATSDHADEQKEQIRDRLCAAHPNAVYRSEATSEYNGFSYAWYLASASNIYCVFNITPYLNDAHTSHMVLSSWTQCQANDIIVYLDANGEPIHAAIVTANNNGDVVAISKWNSECLFTHRVADVPDSMYANPNTAFLSVEVYRVSAHNYSVISYNSSGHTFKCPICNDTYTSAHTMVNGSCRFCDYVGSGAENPFG